MMRQLLSVSLPALAMAFVSPAAAQVAPDLGDAVIQGEILNRDAESTLRTAPAGQATDDEIDGEAGIYVLTVNEIFSVTGDAGLGYMSNPTRSAGDPGGSSYAQADLGFGVATRVAQAADLGVSLNVSGRKFLDDAADVASSQSASASIALGTDLGPVYVGFIGFGGYSFQDGFGDSLGFHGLSANASHTFALSNRLLVRPGIGLTQQWSAASENDSLTLAASADLVFMATSRLVASARAAFFKRSYDDFYEDVTFVKRKDDNFGVSLTLVYRATPSLRLVGGAAFEQQDSTLFLSEFKAHDIAMTASAQFTF